MTQPGQWTDEAVSGDREVVVRPTVEIYIDEISRFIPLEDISYTDTVDEASKPEVSIKPLDENPMDIIGSDCDILIGGDAIASGTITKTGFNRNNEEWQLEVRPQVFDLADESIDLEVEQEFLVDVVENLIQESSSDIQVDIKNYDIETVAEEKQIYNFENFKDAVDDRESNWPLKIEEDKISQLKSAFWVTSDEAIAGGVDRIGPGDDEYQDDAEQEEAMILDTEGQTIRFEFETEYEIPRLMLNFRAYYHTNNPEEYVVKCNFNGSTVKDDITLTSEDSFTWEEFGLVRSVPPGEHEVEIELIEEGPVLDAGLVFDTFIATDFRFVWNFDNNVDSNNLLQLPAEYINTGMNVFFNPIEAGIYLPYVQVDIDTNHTNGDTEIAVREEDPGPWESESNTDSAHFDLEAKNIETSKIYLRLDLSAGGSNGTTSPTSGYIANEVTDVSVTTDVTDNDMIVDTELQGNRLEVLTDLLQDTHFYFRVENDTIVVLKRGEYKTEVDLKKSSVSSEIDIDGSYRSCKVYGKREDVEEGMRFGTSEIEGDTIELDNVPDMIDGHKDIEDNSKKTKAACNQKAYNFLFENSRVKYTGDIETIPTFAPIGEDIDGSIFTHGEDVMIKSVDYGIESTSITCGVEQTFKDEIVKALREIRKNSRKL